MKPLDRLLSIMRRLRDPVQGCPWDREQDFASIAPYTIEEAYEVADAIAREEWDELREELGDLLLQVVFHSQMASERGWFDFDAVAEAIADKMERRHPHVFGTATELDADSQTQSWEAIKAAERDAKGEDASALAGIAVALPALTRAGKLGRRASRVGFDWPDVQGVLAKVREELAELETELSAGHRERIEEEFGDLLFACSGLARHLDIDAEGALRAASNKFERRFRQLETHLAAAGQTVAGTDAEGLDRVWEQVKREERDS